MNDSDELDDIMSGLSEDKTSMEIKGSGAPTGSAFDFSKPAPGGAPTPGGVTEEPAGDARSAPAATPAFDSAGNGRQDLEVIVEAAANKTTVPQSRSDETAASDESQRMLHLVKESQMVVEAQQALLAKKEQQVDTLMALLKTKDAEKEAMCEGIAAISDNRAPRMRIGNSMQIAGSAVKPVSTEETPVAVEAPTQASKAPVDAAPLGNENSKEVCMRVEAALQQKGMVIPAVTKDSLLKLDEQTAFTLNLLLNTQHQPQQPAQKLSQAYVNAEAQRVLSSIRAVATSGGLSAPMAPEFHSESGRAVASRGQKTQRKVEETLNIEAARAAGISSPGYGSNKKGRHDTESLSDAERLADSLF